MLKNFSHDAEPSWPAVTADLQLSNFLASFYVDIPRLGHELREMGMSDEDVAAARVHLGGEEMNPIIEGESRHTIVVKIGEFATRYTAADCSRTITAPPERGAELGLGLTQTIIEGCLKVKDDPIPTLDMGKLSDFATNPIIETKLRHPNWYHMAHYEADGNVYDIHKILAEDGSDAVNSNVNILNEHRLHENEDGPLLRLHSSCIYGEVFGSTDCDCYRQLVFAQSAVEDEGTGIVVYLKSQEGRGANLEAKAHGYRLKDTDGLDTAEAYEKLGLEFDTRDYTEEIAFLVSKGITKVRLMSNNPRKIKALEDAGIKVTRVPIVIPDEKYNDYLGVKRVKAGHLIPDELSSGSQRGSKIARMATMARALTRRIIDRHI